MGWFDYGQCSGDREEVVGDGGVRVVGIQIICGIGQLVALGKQVERC